MNPRYPLVASRAGHRCEYCRAPEAIFNTRFEVEHVEPTARGGEYTDRNLALACRSCNLHKAVHLVGPDERTGTNVPLFHPRRDAWDEHFRADPQTGAVEGLTPAGRATAARLEMNHPLQIEARRLWMRLGLFP